MALPSASSSSPGYGGNGGTKRTRLYRSHPDRRGGDDQRRGWWRFRRNGGLRRKGRRGHLPQFIWAGDPDLRGQDQRRRRGLPVAPQKGLDGQGGAGGAGAYMLGGKTLTSAGGIIAGGTGGYSLDGFGGTGGAVSHALDGRDADPAVDGDGRRRCECVPLEGRQGRRRGVYAIDGIIINGDATHSRSDRRPDRRLGRGRGSRHQLPRPSKGRAERRWRSATPAIG